MTIARTEAVLGGYYYLRQGKSSNSSTLGELSKRQDLDGDVDKAGRKTAKIKGDDEMR